MNAATNTSHACIRCGVDLPRTESENTLISSRFGWRLSRRQNEDGVVTLEWRCAGCWQKEKQAAAASRAAGAWPTEALEQPPVSDVRPLASGRPRALGGSAIPRTAAGRRGG